MSRTVYLAGAVDGRAESEVMDWRKVASIELEKLNMVGVYPPGLGEAGEWLPSEIVTRDLDAVRKSRAILINATIPSFGTAVEMYEAYLNQKLIVAFTTKPPLVSIFVKYYAAACFDSMELSVQYLNKFISQ